MTETTSSEKTVHQRLDALWRESMRWDAKHDHIEIDEKQHMALRADREANLDGSLDYLSPRDGGPMELRWRGIPLELHAMLRPMNVALDLLGPADSLETATSQQRSYEMNVPILSIVMKLSSGRLQYIDDATTDPLWTDGPPPTVDPGVAARLRAMDLRGRLGGVLDTLAVRYGRTRRGVGRSFEQANVAFFDDLRALMVAAGVEPATTEDQLEPDLGPLTVHLVMGNDHPDAIFSSEELAERHMERMKAKDADEKAKGQLRGNIYWRAYDYVVDEKAPAAETDE